MNNSSSLFNLEKFPKSCGVYLMKNEAGKVLYVGKAKNIQNRLKQYFTLSDERTTVPILMAQVAHIETILVDTEQEALLLENNLIKSLNPKYNACLKDDKRYFSLMINIKHPWPRIKVVRFKGKPESDALYFGPYTKGHAAHETLEMLRKLFPLRQCSDEELVRRSRPCILYALKRCMAPCTAKCTAAEYGSQVNRVINFLRGHDTTLVKELTKEMERAASQLEFEKAEALLKTLENIEATLEKQRVEKVGQKDTDVIGLYRLGSEAVLFELFFREGKLMGSADHRFRYLVETDEELLASFLVQNYSEKEFYPKEILLPFAIDELASIEEWLSDVAKQKVTLLVPQKGEKQKLIEMAHKNAEAKFISQKSEQNIQEETLLGLEETLLLTHYPERIECFDNSNISGSEPVSAMVVFVEGEKEKGSYRRFRLRESNAYDDYGALKEALKRRYREAKERGDLPDLLLIDGGRGHLNIAQEVLSELDISTVDLIALSKEASKHTKGITHEKIHLVNKASPIELKAHSPLLLFLQKIRDEAHRFAISYQKTRRSKKVFASQMDLWKGIGPVKKERLLKAFGSVEKIKMASEEELKQVKGITAADIETIKNSFSRNQ